MKTSLIIKINFLILTLFVVIMIIGNLNKNGLPSGVGALFGAVGPGQSSQQLQWCETRVEAVISPEKFKLENVKMKWFVENKSRHEANALSVEKWFGRYCAVQAVLLPNEASTVRSFSPVLLVKFVTDKVEALGRNEDGTFLWRGQTFKSEELTQALNELGELAHSR